MKMMHSHKTHQVIQSILNTLGVQQESGRSVRSTRVLIVAVACMFGNSGCHATIKGAELSYKLGYLIMAALFCPVCPERQVLSVPISEVYLHCSHYELHSS